MNVPKSDHELKQLRTIGPLKTSLLRRLQAQSLPNKAPPIDKIHPFSKMAETFEPLMGF